MNNTFNFPLQQLIEFPLHADIACCGNYSSMMCDYHPEWKLPDADFASNCMDTDVLEAFIQQYSDAQIHSDIKFFWNGGDPLLMPIDYMDKAIRIEKKYAHYTQVFNHIHTPGIRINEDWCGFFRTNQITLSIELDGPTDYFDQYHHLLSCNDSSPTLYQRNRCSRRIIESIDLLQEHNIPFYTIVNVHNLNMNHPIETYTFLKSLGIDILLFNPIVLWNKNRISSESVTPRAYGEFLVKIFDYWSRYDVGDIRILNYEDTMNGPSSSGCEFSKNCGHHSCISIDGHVYPCKKYTMKDECIGSIFDDTFTGLMYGRKQLKFGSGKHSGLTSQCHNCPYLEYCYGGCPCNRKVLSESGQKGHQYLCEAYKIYFGHVLTPLKYLAEEVNLGHNPSRLRDYYT